MDMQTFNSPSGARAPATHSILVVDDSADDRVLLANFLHARGFRTYIASDGADGYRKAKAIRPDMVLMDIAMPVCDGLTACRRLKADRDTSHIPLIFLSAAALPVERVSGLAAGAVDYITKPFDFDEVQLRLAIHLRRHDRGGAEALSGSGYDDIPLRDTATGNDAALFRDAQAIVRANLQSMPDLTTIACATGASARRLTLAFRRCVGLTPFDYAREERLRKARRLLTETPMSIGAIASVVGYGGAANFSTAFKERFGVTPSSLRQAAPADASVPAYSHANAVS